MIKTSVIRNFHLRNYSYFADLLCIECFAMDMLLREVLVFNVTLILHFVIANVLTHFRPMFLLRRN